MHTELGVDALQIAIWQRRPLSGGVHDIELGQYTSVAFTAELVDAGIAGSIATVGGALDNALCESAMGLFITEAYRPGPAAWQWLLCSAVGACRSGGRSASHVRSATPRSRGVDRFAGLLVLAVRRDRVNNRGVEVQVVYLDGCPSWRVAFERLRSALDATGRSARGSSLSGSSRRRTSRGRASLFRRNSW